MKQFFISLHQTLNTLLGGMADETLSAAAYRTERKNRLLGIAFRPLIDLIFLPIERDHCHKAYEAERRGSQLPKEYQV